MQQSVTEHDLNIRVNGAVLPGTLTLPGAGRLPRGLVLFVHGSGSSRTSPRNRQVAHDLVHTGVATLLFDLLTPYEAADRRNVFDIGLLARRVMEATHWMRNDPETMGMPSGYFGASTGAAAALVAAAELGNQIKAVVSRGGRPDLAGDALLRVVAPTLLLVGSLDEEVLELNHRAQHRMQCVSELIVVPGAGHLFEEPGALEQVSRHAAEWFARHL